MEIDEYAPPNNAKNINMADHLTICHYNVLIRITISVGSNKKSDSEGGLERCRLDQYQKQ